MSDLSETPRAPLPRASAATRLAHAVAALVALESRGKVLPVVVRLPGEEPDTLGEVLLDIGAELLEKETRGHERPGVLPPREAFVFMVRRAASVEREKKPRILMR